MLLIHPLLLLLQSTPWISFETTPQLALPIVGVRFNGSEPYRMLVDPSVKEILLDESLVMGAGMKVTKRGEVQEIDYYGKPESVEVGYLEALEVGPVKAPIVRLLLIDGDDTTSSDGVKVYGRIGSDFLAATRLTVFYPRNLLLIEPSPASDVPEGGVPFAVNLRFVTVSGSVNESLEGSFIIDPGASHSIIDRDWARKNHLVDKKATVLTLQSLKIGGFRLENLPTVLEPMDKLPYKKNRPLGVLGATVLRKLALTYDFPRKLLWLRSVEGNP